MFKDLFTNASLLDLPVVAMLGFLFVFLASVWCVTRKHRSNHYDAMSRLPLDES